MRARFDPAGSSDTSYDQIEQLRARLEAVATPDTSYDRIEHIRGVGIGQSVPR